MLLNLSNHPSAQWSDKQMTLALSLYGSVHDLEFPLVPPDANEDQIDALAQNYFQLILNKRKKMIEDQMDFVVHIQGEFTFCFRLVSLLKMADIKCIASTTHRDVVEENGQKTSIFRFVRFRNY